MSHTVPTEKPVYYRTYSRVVNGRKEHFDETLTRALNGAYELGKYTDEQKQLIEENVRNKYVLPSGRFLWVGGTEFIKNPANYVSAYNCCGIRLEGWEDFAENFDNLHQGSGVGTTVTQEEINSLPNIVSAINLDIRSQPGELYSPYNNLETTMHGATSGSNRYVIEVGDTRKGWTDAYTILLELASTPIQDNVWNVEIDFGYIRPAGTPIKGFGGVANPQQLVPGFQFVAKLLSGAVGRKLNTVEVILLLNTGGKIAVAGNIRRSARMNQGDYDDTAFISSKDNLWTQTEDGKWIIDPNKDALVYANHTRLFYTAPTKEQVREAIEKQYYSGEGAIMYVPEALARTNADLLNTRELQIEFMRSYELEPELAKYILRNKAPDMSERELHHRMHRWNLNPCLVAETLILTKEGHYPIEELVGKEVKVWDGKDWFKVNNFRVTGENQPVYTVTLSSGQSITATPYHTFLLEDGVRKQLNDLEEGDKLSTHDIRVHGDINVSGAYLKGFLVGDGTIVNYSQAGLHLYAPKFLCKDRLIASANEIEPNLSLISKPGTYAAISEPGFAAGSDQRTVMQGLSVRSYALAPWITEYRQHFPTEVLNWSYEDKLNFVAGYMDADGCACDNKNGFMYQATSIYKDWLLGFQVLLRTIGVKSTLGLNKSGGTKDFKQRGGVCIVRPLYRLTISQINSIALGKQVVFSRLTNFATKSIKYLPKSKEATITSINFSGVVDKVYCCTVNSTHTIALSNGLLVGQCGEILG